MSYRSLAKKEPDSARDLDDIARRLLRAAGVGDKLPTPQDDIFDCAELVIGGEIDLDDFKDTFFGKIGRALHSGWQRLRGILDFRERTIYINPDTPETQMTFLKFHEVAHSIIPWQVDTYNYFGDDSYTLSRAVKNEYEMEANHLGAKLQFQLDRFKKEARDYELSINTGRMLAEKYDGSYHSTLWEYAETHSSKCILLILKECKHYNIGNCSSGKPYRLLYTVPSKQFLKEFGEIAWIKEYESDHPYTAVVYDPECPDVYEGEVELKNRRRENVKMNFEAWYNQYNIFILIWEKRRRILPKKQVVFHK